ncbi:hypothetical protein Lalb_Chr04g0257751 [Lupinus albus]|uniref:Uncharacterized protein n=1 Tax=Lupinus albus TaxID=3870 RepID=A0A6A4QQZ2_LUPAL|nr:hypothetical protein Lalb_Chr04g0257751 [Lupinus albus]
MMKGNHFKFGILDDITMYISGQKDKMMNTSGCSVQLRWCLMLN